ncbi:hypothetical protein Hdeb2414_s0168g00821431 [Helianthus debilis subsp. tardiflorus]
MQFGSVRAVRFRVSVNTWSMPVKRQNGSIKVNRRSTQSTKVNEGPGKVVSVTKWFTLDFI